MNVTWLSDKRGEFCGVSKAVDKANGQGSKIVMCGLSTSLQAAVAKK